MMTHFFVSFLSFSRKTPLLGPWCNRLVAIRWENPKKHRTVMVCIKSVGSVTTTVGKKRKNFHSEGDKRERERERERSRKKKKK